MINNTINKLALPDLKTPKPQDWVYIFQYFQYENVGGCGLRRAVLHIPCWEGKWSASWPRILHTSTARLLSLYQDISRPSPVKNIDLWCTLCKVDATFHISLKHIETTCVGHRLTRISLSVSLPLPGQFEACDFLCSLQWSIQVRQCSEGRYGLVAMTPPSCIGPGFNALVWRQADRRTGGQLLHPCS